MAVDRKELDLIMKAQFQGKQTLDDVVKTISNLEDVIKKQTEAAKKGEVSLDDLRATALALKDAQEKLKSVAGATGEYERLAAKVLETAQKAQVAAQKYEEFTQSLKGVDSPTQVQIDKQAALGKTSDNLARKLAEQREQLTRLESALRETGIETNKLAEAGERAKTIAAESAISYRNLQDSINSFSSKSGGKNSLDLFNESGRTTLSLFQRIRGEVLSLAAAYVGLYGAIDGAKKSLDAYNEKQGILNMLTVQSGGDKKKAAEEYDYIRGQAERLGISLAEASKGYAKFSAAATWAGRSVQENRFVFESIAEVGRVAHLSAEQMQRVFYAISQIDSKGRVMAEEFNQQLGDALPGLTGIAKKATEGIFTDFNAAMKDGKVSLGVFVDILAKYREAVSGQLPDALKTLQADQERFNNSVYEFKVLVAESGFADSFKGLVNELSTFFRSDDGRRFAQKLSDGLSLVVDLLKWMVKHLDEIILAVKILADLFAARLMVNMMTGLKDGIGWLVALKAELKSVTTASWGAATALERVAMATKMLVGSLTAFMVGWDIGTYLYNQFEVVQKYAQLTVAWIDYLITSTTGYFKSMKALVTGGLEDSKKAIAETRAELARIEKVMADIRSMGSEQAKPATKGAPTSTPKPTDSKDAERRELQKIIDAELVNLETNVKRKAPGAMDAIRVSYEKVLAEIKELGGREGDALLKRLESLHNKQLAYENSHGQKRVDLRKQIEEQLSNLEAKIDRKDKDSLEARRKSINESYTKLENDIAKLGKSGYDLHVRLALARIDLIDQEDKAFYKKRTEAEQKINADVSKIHEEAGKKDKESYVTRREAAVAEVRRRNDEILKLIEQEVATADQTRKGATATPEDKQKSADEIARLNVKKEQLAVDAKALELLTTKKVTEEQVNKFEKDLNEQIARRKMLLEEQQVLERNGAQSPEQTRIKTGEIIKQSNEDFQKLKREYDDFRKSAGDVLSPEQIQKLDAVFLKTAQDLKNLNGELFNANNVGTMMVDGMMTGFQSIAKSIGGAIAHTNSWKDVITATRDAFLKFAADFLMQVGTMILRAQLLKLVMSETNGQSGGNNSGGNSSAGYISTFLNYFAGSQHHSGGIVGQGGASRQVNGAWFTDAPRYHSGGIAGLAPNEVPAILQRNEEVLRTNDPRNILNGGAAAGAKPQGNNVKIMNMIDSASVVSEGLSSPSGEQVLYNFIRANSSGIRQLLNGN